MAKKTKKQCARPEKSNRGCMFSLISIFDPRHGHSTQKLLSDTMYGSRRETEAPGNGDSTEKLKVSGINENDPKKSEDVNGSETEEFDLGTSIKVLMEREMSGVEQPGKVPKADTENLGKENENFLISHDLEPRDQSSASVSDESSNLNTVQSFSRKLYLAALLEELSGDGHPRRGLLVDSKERTGSGDHKKSLVEMAESLINQAAKGTSSGASHQSEEFARALEILNSEELLRKHLQDPSSPLVKLIQEVKTGKKGGRPKKGSRLFEKWNEIPRPREEPMSRKLDQKQGIRRLFRKKEKLEGMKISNGNDGEASFDRIVVLESTPPVIHDSPHAMRSRTPEPRYSLRAGGEKDRFTSHFSLKEIKRRMKHAIRDYRKDQHAWSLGSVLHIIPYKHQKSGDFGQTKPASKVSHTKEHTTWKSFNMKEKATKLKSKEAPPSIKSAAEFQSKNISIASTSASLNREHEFQREARKHLVVMLNSVKGEEKPPAVTASKPLGRMLSLSGYNSPIPMLSPEREKDTFPSTGQMRISPLWQPNQENVSTLSPSENIENTTFTSSSRTLDEVSNSSLSTREHENVFSEGISGPEYITELSDQEHTPERESLDVVFKLNATGPIDVAERHEEEMSSLSPRSGPSEASQTVILLVPTTPATLLVQNMLSPESIAEKPERPSPVSVLEPLFSEGDSSPEYNTEKRVDFLDLPCRIHFDEHEESAEFLATTGHGRDHKSCLEDEESRAEYVRAVLEASGLMQSGLSERWHSSSPLLSSSLYDEVEHPSAEFPDDLRLLFDSACEVLEVIREKFFHYTPWVSFVKPSARLIPSGENLVMLILKGIAIHCPSRPPDSLEEIVGKDLQVGVWMDLRSEIESIDTDIEDAILEDIMEEVILQFQL
ncbi:unnamed protein product [Spirodela intermedia]|uniref:Uncharacterized protein n=1 Tax=Spirodela intermedia TaxID=51605 RepID=A0A7I8ICT5_SPIIN|nr:unnamed protein product [Spirodela intermedia]CAA6655580.1 unnamed protein product [Spirodela intermedia]